MGSKEIMNLGYRCGFAFIGLSGEKSVNESRAKNQKEEVGVTQVFQISCPDTKGDKIRHEQKM